MSDDPTERFGTLPRCIAEPPWLAPAEPWPAREIEMIVDPARERVVETDALRRTREQMTWDKQPPSPELDKEILARKGVLDAAAFFQLSDDAAFENIPRLGAYMLGCALARFGDRAIARVSAVMTNKPTTVHAPLLAQLRTPRLARIALAFHKDEDWLLEDPQLSAIGLIPDLFAVQLERRYDGELGLLRLCVAGHRALVDEAARRYGEEIAAEVGRILGRDPWQRLPPRLPQLREVDEKALPVLSVADGPLPPSSIRTIRSLLAVSRTWWSHPGLLELRRVCTLASREAFAWELYKKTGNMDVLAHLGGDDCVRKLDQELSARRNKLKPDQVHRAYDVLASIGSQLALMLLVKHALLSPWRDRNERIASHLAAASKLEEDVFPATLAGSDAMVIDYGARRFRVVLDEQLHPSLEDVERSARIAKLPKPTKKDDPAKVAEAMEKLEALRLDLDDVRETILLWFERAMAEERSWDRERFRHAIVAHPLLVQIARRLVWQTGGRFFRVCEDGTFADEHDASLEVQDGERITVAHPVHLSAEARERFRHLFADYKIIQPFAQLERETFQLSKEESAGSVLARFSGRRVATARLNGLYGARGWQHGARDVPHKRLGRHVVAAEIEARSIHKHGETAADRLGAVKLLTAGATFADLTAVEASELLRDLETLPSA